MASNQKDIFSVKDKVIIITGGAGFLGLQYAEALGNAGAQVIIFDAKDRASIEENVAPLLKTGMRIESESVDITNESEVERAVQKVAETYGRIDALINNAAMAAPLGGAQINAQFLPYEDYPVDLWEKELKINLTGTMICTKAVAPIMMKQKYGSIINGASEVSVIAHDHRLYNDSENKKFKSIAYVTTKAALLGFTRQWAARLGAYNVRVNTFSPTGVQTPVHTKDFVERYGATTMFGRMAQVGEYNGTIIFLCSDASSYMTGHNLIVDGGKSAW
jgi:NAD(P)-dependent dehydrogenase (short-subunit alcohol dehydrogenase family)